MFEIHQLVQCLFQFLVFPIDLHFVVLGSLLNVVLHQVQLIEFECWFFRLLLANQHLNCVFHFDQVGFHLSLILYEVVNYVLLSLFVNSIALIQLFLEIVYSFVQLFCHIGLFVLFLPMMVQLVFVDQTGLFEFIVVLAQYLVFPFERLDAFLTAGVANQIANYGFQVLNLSFVILSFDGFICGLFEVTLFLHSRLESWRLMVGVHMFLEFNDTPAGPAGLRHSLVHVDGRYCFGKTAQ